MSFRLQSTFIFFMPLSQSFRHNFGLWLHPSLRGSQHCSKWCRDVKFSERRWYSDVLSHFSSWRLHRGISTSISVWSPPKLKPSQSKIPSHEASLELARDCITSRAAHYTCRLTCLQKKSAKMLLLIIANWRGRNRSRKSRNGLHFKIQLCNILLTEYRIETRKNSRKLDWAFINREVRGKTKREIQRER